MANSIAAKSYQLGKCVCVLGVGLALAAVLGSYARKVVAAQESQESSKSAAAASPESSKSTVVAEFHEKVEPILSTYCYECHGGGEKKGGVQLDELRDDTLAADLGRWSKVLKNVRARVMPPAGSDRPSEAEVQTLANWVKYRAFGIDPNDIDPGQVTIHRLNRNEYRNTIHDLLGVDFNAADELPPDASGLGFDNIADLLSVSPLMLEKYLNAAEAVLDGAFPSETFRGFVAEGSAVRGGGGAVVPRLGFNGSPEVAFNYRNESPGAYQIVLKLEVVGAEPPAVEMPKPEPAKAEEAKPDAVKPETAKTDNAQPEAAKSEAAKPDIAKPDPAKSEDAKSDAANAEAPKADLPKPEPPRTGHLVVSLQSGTADKVTLLSQEFAPEAKSYEFTFDQNWTTEPHKIAFNIVAPLGQEGARRGFGGRGLGRGGPQGPRFVIKSVAFKPQQTALAKRFFPLDVPPIDANEQREYIRHGISDFGLRTYRRPIDPQTVDRLAAEVETAYHDSAHFNESIKPGLVKLLCSPRFLFRIDRPVDLKGEQKRWALIDEYSLASRLSYFLWSSMPDDELLSLAGHEQLRANLPAQIQRMLASEKSRSFIEDFSGQWLQTRNVMNWSIVEKAVLDREGVRSFKPVLTPAIRQAMVDETTMFFNRIVREDRSTLEFIDSDYTYLNEDLAGYYKIPGVTGKEMRLVSLTKDNHRGGVLTQGSMLLVTSNSNRTSPVKRGVFVLDKFLGLRPHDPPPNVPGLEDASKSIKDHDPTFREMLELHRADTLCASCHKLMDPIGLALENFNALGIYREKEFGQPIDAAGKLITGEEFKGIDDLKQVLLTSHRTNFYRCLTEKLLTYGLGRELGYYDAESVDRIVDRLQAENGKFSALLAGVIESAPFQKRRLVETQPAAAGSGVEPPRASP